MKNEKENNKKGSGQAGIALRLKLLTAFIALAGAVFFGGCTCNLIRNKHYFEKYGISCTPVLIMVGITAILCYAVLWQFWKVCTQIGRENSFSIENHFSFRVMSGLFLILAAAWGVGAIVYLFLAERLDYMILFKIVELIIIWLVAAGLTGALAKLIDKARQIREENDLTI